MRNELRLLGGEIIPHIDTRYKLSAKIFPGACLIVFRQSRIDTTHLSIDQTRNLYPLYIDLPRLPDKAALSELLGGDLYLITM